MFILLIDPYNILSKYSPQKVCFSVFMQVCQRRRPSLSVWQHLWSPERQSIRHHHEPLWRRHPEAVLWRRCYRTCWFSSCGHWNGQSAGSVTSVDPIFGTDFEMSFQFCHCVLKLFGLLSCRGCPRGRCGRDSSNIPYAITSRNQEPKKPGDTSGAPSGHREQCNFELHQAVTTYNTLSLWLHCVLGHFWSLNLSSTRLN